MTDISIIGTGCLIVALVVAAGIVIWQRMTITALRLTDEYWWDQYVIVRAEVRAYRDAEANRQAQRIAAAKKGRATQTARALAKVAK